MTQHPVRLFDSDSAIRRIGEGLLARTLARSEWTHEAHLAATLWLMTERPDIEAERELPDIIRAYNAAVGGVNDDHQGYHETITQTYIAAIRDHLAERPGNDGLLASVNALLTSPRGHRDWPLRLYSRERLFSVTARRRHIEPDLPCAPDAHGKAHAEGKAGENS